VRVDRGKRVPWPVTAGAFAEPKLHNAVTFRPLTRGAFREP